MAEECHRGKAGITSMQREDAYDGRVPLRSTPLGTNARNGRV